MKNKDEITKAIEICLGSKIECSECPYNKVFGVLDNNCVKKLLKDVIEFLNSK